MDSSWEVPSPPSCQRMGWKRSAPREQGLPGLAYYDLEVESKEELLDIVKQAQELEAPIKWLNSSELDLVDQDGIVTRIRLAR